MSSRRRLDIHNHHERSHKQNLEHTAQLTALNTAQTSTNTKIDNLSGAINNNIGDGSVKLQTYVYAHDTAGGLARPLKCDTSGRLECSVDALEVTAETINLNTDTLETLQTATKNALFTNPAGSGNTIGENASAINSNIITSNSKLDTIISNTASSSSTGLATESTLSGLKNSLTGDGAGGDNAPGVMLKAINDNIINTNTVALAGIDQTLQGQDNILDDIKNAQTQDGNGGGNAPGVMLNSIQTELTSIKTAVQILDNIVSGSEAQVDIVAALPTGSNTIGKVNIGTFDSAITVNAGTNLNTSALATQSTLADAEAHLGNIETAVQLLDNIVSGCEAQVDIVAPLPAGTNAIGKLAANSGVDIGDVDVLSLPALPSGSNTIGKVNIGTFDSAITVNAGTNLNTSALATQSTLADAEAHLGNIETSVQLIDDIVKTEDTAHSGGDKGVMALSVRKDTATFLAGSDADYQPLITDANGRLHGINKTARANSSETSYVSSQSISGSGGTFTGSSIAIDPNTKVIFAEHNFSNSAIKYELMASIDGTNFFGTGVEFNAGGMTPGTTTGINTILGSSQQVVSFPPHIKFKFTNSDGSSQNATLSYVIQSS